MNAEHSLELETHLDENIYVGLEGNCLVLGKKFSRPGCADEYYDCIFLEPLAVEALLRYLAVYQRQQNETIC